MLALRPQARFGGQRPQVRLLGRRYRPGLWRRRAPILKLPRCGGRERPPYGTGRTWRPTGKTRRRKAPGRAMALPYKPSEMPRQTGTAVTIRASVGRDALIPPHPAAAQTPPGGYGIRPYGQRQTPRPTGKPRRRKAPREGHGPPLQTMANNRPPGAAMTTRASVGRDALIPPHPAAAQTSAGGYGIRPYE